MTLAVSPKRRPLERLLGGSRSLGLFVIGVLLDTLGLVNVPGAVTFAQGEDTEAHITTAGVLIFLLAVACWATVFVRVRAPLAVVVAGGVLMLLGVSYALALVGVYCALVRWPRKTTQIALSTAAAVLLFVLRELLGGWGGALAWTFASDTSADEAHWHIATVVVAVLSLATVAGLVAYRRARVEASAQRVQAEHEHQRAEALDAQLARQSERERIARDLHDGLGHRLSSMALAAGAFESQAAAAPVDPALAEWARLVRHQAHAALEDVRGVVGGLRSDGGVGGAAPQASLRLVAGLLADLRAAGYRLDAYVLIEGIEHARPARDAAAYRIVQESLTNAIKHAPGAAISVTADAAPDRGIRIRVENPLMPVSTGVPGGRRGIAGIRERAAAEGGTSWIGPHEGRFIVDVSLPWG
ncbi:histidine kinase [Microbacterium sp. BWT-B31]|uniref:sensor histidine kinase n=1 Tax=Microbacterium sp. BWT-B31 TaxID=3232072 RepID=UPI003527A6C1